MADVQKLCVVEDMFFITGRGPVITPGQWQAGQIRPGDWIELRSVTGECHLALVKSIEGVRFISTADRMVDANQLGSLLLAGIDRAFIHRGDEVWSVANPPAAELVATLPFVPKKHWWQRLFRNVPSKETQ